MSIITIVGSRNTPKVICDVITEIAKEFAAEGWTLRSGGANGADLAGETGFDLSFSGAKKEIYLPWKKFNKSSSTLIAPEFENWQDALEILKQVYPWEVKDSILKLHGRNVYQVLGRDLKSPSNVILAFTEGGSLIGGTATALKLGSLYNVPIVNLGNGVENSKLLLAEIMDKYAQHNQTTKTS